MKVMFDLNVVLDVVQQREPHYRLSAGVLGKVFLDDAAHRSTCGSEHSRMVVFWRILERLFNPDLGIPVLTLLYLDLTTCMPPRTVRCSVGGHMSRVVDDRG